MRLHDLLKVTVGTEARFKNESFDSNFQVLSFKPKIYKGLLAQYVLKKKKDHEFLLFTQYSGATWPLTK